MSPEHVAVHVMAKPTGAACNLGCRYCFYLQKESLYPGSGFRMTDEVAESYIRQVIELDPRPEVAIAWQGGEPTLMGLDFFRKVVDLERKYQRPGTTILNTLQTNGVLLDDEWCAFMRESRFLVGLSLDGPQRLHDALRVDRGGAPTFKRVMASARRLRRHRVDFNILCTVNRVNGDHPLEVYRFLRDDVGARFIQFVPVVERDGSSGRTVAGATAGAVTAESVGPEQLGRFMIAIFDEWVRRDVGHVFVRHFDAALASWLFGESTLCLFQSTCGTALVLEHNGDLFSCDHFVSGRHRLGNILTEKLADLVRSPAQAEFAKAKLTGLPEGCLQCEVRFACHGECPKNRIPVTTGGDATANYLCAGYQAFFQHIGRPMRLMANLVRRGLPADGVMQLLALVGREERSVPNRRHP